jgi:hypothetical protein
MLGVFQVQREDLCKSPGWGSPQLQQARWGTIYRHRRGGKETGEGMMDHTCPRSSDPSHLYRTTVFRLLFTQVGKERRTLQLCRVSATGRHMWLSTGRGLGGRVRTINLLILIVRLAFELRHRTSRNSASKRTYCISHEKRRAGAAPIFAWESSALVGVSRCSSSYFYFSHIRSGDPIMQVRPFLWGSG